MKRTLDQTWTLCLRMWKHITRRIEDVENPIDLPPGYLTEVIFLKEKWLEDNSFGDEDIMSDCFFCEHCRNRVGCCLCPGRLVDPEFDCEHPEHHYRENPREFYRELLRLNRIRKAKK